MGNKLSTGDATVDTVIYGPFGLQSLPSSPRRMRSPASVAAASSTACGAAPSRKQGHADLRHRGHRERRRSGDPRGHHRHHGDRQRHRACVDRRRVRRYRDHVGRQRHDDRDEHLREHQREGRLGGHGGERRRRDHHHGEAEGPARELAPRLDPDHRRQRRDIGTTSSVTAQTFFSGGTTADSNATALATIVAQRYYYIVSAAEDATQFGALAAQVSSQALPTTGIRQRCFAGSVDTEANAQTIAVTLNNARAEVIWMEKADWTPGELAADAAALYALGEAASSIQCNWDSLGLGPNTLDTLWTVPYPRSGTTPTRTTIKAALNNGLTPIGISSSGAPTS